MISNVIIVMFLQMVHGFFSVIPNMPPTPEPLQTGATAIFQIIGSVTNFFHMVYTPVLFNVIIVLIIAIFLFDQIFDITMFVLKKLHIIG